MDRTTGPVDPHRHVRGRQARDLSDGHRVHVFEIRDDDLAIQRLELLNQHRHPFQVDSLVRSNLALGHVREHIEFFQTDERRKIPVLTHDIRSSNIVNNAVDPGPERAAGIVPLKTPPQLKMNVLA
jgi:hypothetical protein